MKNFNDYFALLRELSGILARLSESAQAKAEAVRADDLNALDAVIKQEQALALSLRGCEQKRVRLMADLGLEGGVLSDLTDQCPPELRLEAKAAVEGLQRQYRLYQGAAGTARNLLEINLHQIERFLSGPEAPGGGVGYAAQPAPVEPPAPMKTDFRV